MLLCVVVLFDGLVLPASERYPRHSAFAVLVCMLLVLGIQTN